MNTIKFWKTSDEYGAFSNFLRREIIVNNTAYASSEHYFQCKKFEGTEWEDHVASQPIPHLAAKEGRRRDLPLRSNWEEVKDSVMLAALRAKFTQHKDLKELLLNTGDALLVEDSPYDSYWGVGKDGTGKNKLGILLMQVREEIRERRI